MWLFSSQRPDAEDEAEQLREEAKELRLKFEAVEMAEYRDQLRAAVRATAAASSGTHSLEGGNGQEDWDDIEAMYDFSRFAPGMPPMSRAPGQESLPEGATQGELSPALLQLRQAEMRCQEREQRLEAEAEAQAQKLAAASRALQKTRDQAQQLSEQLGARESEGLKPGPEAGDLQRLMLEKEQRLQAALDEAAAAISQAEGGAREAMAMPMEAAPSPPPLPPEDYQQPQEAPTSAAPASITPTDDVDEEQLLQLAAITEELTDALEAARDSEETLRKQLDTAAVQLHEERERRANFERDLVESREASESEFAALLARLKERDDALAREFARANELEGRSQRHELEATLAWRRHRRGKAMVCPVFEI